MRTYDFYKQALRGHHMPCAFVDLELFDANTREIAARAGSKRIRIATKSVRCVHLIERVLECDSVYQGVMAYSLREAVFLSHQGIDDILVGYPAYDDVEDSGLAEELLRGKRITLMVDCEEQVRQCDRYGKEFNTVIPLCMDLDMSTQFPGLYFGVLRSPIKTPDQAVSLGQIIRMRKYVALVGVMGYEAQIAGLPDAVPGSWAFNGFVQFLKKRSLTEVRERRARIVEALRLDGHTLALVNGGGTGSMETTREEACITEVTVGSGFYSPTLFDHYAGFRHQPAAGYAIEITRIPKHGVYTCQGGGYVASGTGAVKQPKPYLPDGARLNNVEGAGEVQTPIHYTGPERLAIGDPIIMRYAKAGELCERFNALLLIENGQVTTETPTYRGEGQAFG
ncbi:MAG TPA: amino acid deaminase/aldolase [Candidatus Hydrogenedentes bacterium]|nr:amino acid deaminase/aldolase [Candidatus Hydrogenedentota bacterium]